MPSPTGPRRSYLQLAHVNPILHQPRCHSWLPGENRRNDAELQNSSTATRVLVRLDLGPEQVIYLVSLRRGELCCPPSPGSSP